MTKPTVCLAILLGVTAGAATTREVRAAPPSAHGTPGPAPTPGTPPPVIEETPLERAAKLRDEGNQAMLEMRYVDALSSYQQSLAVAPDFVGVLYSIARAHQLLGEFPEALTTLETFDRRAGPEIKAKVGRLDQLFAELRARVGTLQLGCNVSGARVILRDKVIGTTPLPATRLQAGSATLQVELEGFFPLRREIVVPAGGSFSFDVELHARSNSGLLIVHTTPSGAQILVDGHKQGTTTPSIEVALTSGPHRITALREGYDEASVPLVLNAGATRDLRVQLEESVPLSHRWWFWTGAGAVVAGSVALAVALTTERRADKGTLTPGQIAAPLHF